MGSNYYPAFSGHGANYGGRVEKMTSVQTMVTEGTLVGVCTEMEWVWIGFHGDVMDYIDSKLGSSRAWPMNIVNCLMTYDFSKKNYASLRTD